MHANIHSSTNYNSQDIEATQIHILSHTHTMDIALPFAAMWMNINKIMISEISETENDKYYMISLI